MSLEMTGERPEAPVLAARELSKRYVRPAGLFGGGKQVFEALCGVSIELKAGATTALIGESGSGKSTLARCLAGLEPPDAGDVRLEGTSLLRLSSAELRRRRRAIQIVFQNTAAALNPWMTIEEIVEEPMAVEGIGRAQRREKAQSHMESVGIPGAWRGRKPHELSGGQRQRVGLARALAAAPRILLLDEVMSGLDLPAQRELVDLLTNLQTSHSLTYLFITHDLRLAGSIAATVAVLDRGRLIECSPTRELFSNPRESKTRLLLSAIRRLDPSGFAA